MSSLLLSIEFISALLSVDGHELTRYQSVPGLDPDGFKVKICLPRFSLKPLGPDVDRIVQEVRLGS